MTFNHNEAPFKPQQVDIWRGSIAPFVTMFGKAEMETCAALLVAYVTERDNSWQHVRLDKFIDWIQALPPSKSELRRLAMNPFLRPHEGLSLLIEAGYLAQDVGAVVHFTNKFLDKIKDAVTPTTEGGV